MRRFFTYPIILILLISFIGSLVFGSLIKYHFEGGKKYQTLQKTAMFFGSIPGNIVMMIKHKTINLHKVLNKPPISTKHKDKKRFEQFIPNKRNALLMLARYDNALNRSIVDIVDLNNFELIHTYKHNISEMWKKVQNTQRFPKLKMNHGPIRFLYFHPIILNDGSLITDGNETPLFKIDICSNLEWINDQELFHHSKMLDHEKNIWVTGTIKPRSKYIKKYQFDEFEDDAIIKINTDGEILYKKSVMEILIENNFLPSNFAINSYLLGETDPIHINDIEPTFSDTQYWKKGDVFLSIRNQSAIIHYRPSTNKVINYITGPFFHQHDVDIISDKEISIFNNNVYILETNHYEKIADSNLEYRSKSQEELLRRPDIINDGKVMDSNFSEVLIYNFETLQFRKLFKDQLQNDNFKAVSNGLSHTFNDGALMIEETLHGRIILLNNKGEKEWEFINKDKNGDIGILTWTRVIEDELFIQKFKSLIKNKKCTN